MNNSRYKARPHDEAYKYICMEISLLEQKQIFGTIGLNNILQKYDREDAIYMVKLHLDMKAA